MDIVICIVKSKLVFLLHIISMACLNRSRDISLCVCVYVALNAGPDGGLVVVRMNVICGIWKAF